MKLLSKFHLLSFSGLGCAMIINFCVFCQGMGQSWTSPVLVKLKDEANLVLDRPITDYESSWIASISFIAGLTALVFFAFLADRLGRKASIIMFSLPRVLCYLTMIVASKVWMVLIGRFLMGLSDAFTAPAVSIYSSEIANKEIRGALGTLMQISTSVGMVIMLSIGPFLDFITLNVIALGMSVLACIPLFFLPDSPYFLFTKGNIAESKRILIYLRGSEKLADDEILDYKANNEKKVESSRLTDVLKTPRFLKSIGIVMFMSFLSAMSGMSIVNTYLQTLLLSTNSSFSSDFSSAIIGVIQLLACVCTVLGLDRFGRKPILLLCQIGMALGFVIMGLFFSLTSDQASIEGVLNYLPLMALIVIVFCFNAGVGCILFTLISELLDGRIRVLGMTVCQVTGLSIIILNVTFFQAVVSAIGDAATYWIFSVTNIVMFLFVALFVPETKGKSFTEIQHSLGAEKERENRRS